MTVRELLQQVKGAERMVEDIMDHEVEVRLHTSDGIYLGRSFVAERIGYKFSTILVNEDGTKGSMVIDISICENPPLAKKKRTI